MGTLLKLDVVAGEQNPAGTLTKTLPGRKFREWSDVGDDESAAAANSRSIVWLQTSEQGGSGRKFAARQRSIVKWSSGCETSTSVNFRVGVAGLSGQLNGCGQEI